MNTSNESYTTGLAVSDDRILHVIAENGTSIARELPQFQIFGGDVTTPKITNSNVTTDKIANSNVTTAKIAADAVTNAKIANDSIDV